MEHRVDFLVIGSGIAGLTYALNVAPHGKVVLLTKSSPDETNTKYAQGGIAAVMYAPDSYHKHIQDTLIAGDGLCNPEVVKMVIEESTQCVEKLINWGASFDRTVGGEYDLAKEGGHSEHRILHHKDNTGFEIERALLQQVQNHPNITILDYYFSLDIITQHHLGEYINSKSLNINCYGVYALNLKTNLVEKFLASITVIASGGAGQVYEATTNPTIATADGVAMVYRAKGRITGMEFMQFHPTSLYNPGESPSFLISEAVRGFGAKLRNQSGELFMARYDKRLELAPRDIVARAIDNEMKVRGDDYVYLDCTHLDKESFIAHFPNIYNKCVSIGVDPFKNYVPVVPAAHYMCGGIEVNLNAQSTINYLYAIGECAGTGVHGANRLASNSLLEALVYANKAAEHSLKHYKNNQHQFHFPEWDSEGTVNPEELILLTQSLKELRSIMTNYVGIVRSNIRLKRAFDRLLILHQETEDLYERTKLSKQLCELRNMIKVGYVIIKQAMQRKESVGLHYNIDYPHK
ncbi:MAG: L-aspartate oxidase [Bacteroidia bacterium]|nr:L-aspartate oxidase [Bacteroidia bacterium]